MSKDRPPVDCPNRNKLFHPCRFEARYDGVEPGMSLFKVLRLESNSASGAPHVRYVRDVCVRCGRTLERNDE